MMAEGERLLYPCYFNSALTRDQGRRVPRGKAVKNPCLADLEKALRKMKVAFRSEQHHHPCHWWKREGRIIVSWGAHSKEDLIKEVARYIEVKK